MNPTKKVPERDQRPILLRSTCAALLLAFGLAFLSQAATVRANDAIPNPWRTSVFDAGFVGIAECEVAGGIVAKYRVIESWKGPPIGAVLNLAREPDDMGDQYPLSLCGERYLFAADRCTGRIETQRDSRPGNGNPLFLRSLAPTFVAHAPASVVKLQAGDSIPYWLNLHHLSLKDLHDSVSSFVSIPGEQQEAIVLGIHSRQFLGMARHAVDSQLPPSLLAMSGSLDTSTAAEIVERWLEIARADSMRWSGLAMLSLAYGGGSVALGTLERVDLGTVFGKAQPFWGSTVSPSFPLECIRVRLGLEPRERLYPEEYSFAVRVSCEGASAADIRQKVLGRKRWNHEAQVAFDHLCVCDPDTAVELLLDGSLIDPSGLAGIYPDQGYVLGSYFAWRCGKDRRKYLRSLLSASDPSIQVAGAAYLCFENEREGIRELRTRMKLSGDPGTWAAINLARRGDKSAVPRALEALAAPPDPTFMGEWHRTLEGRLMELISNSAEASDVPQPSLDGISTYDQSERRSQRFARYILWWHTYSERIHLTDPWLSELSRQKVD